EVEGLDATGLDERDDAERLDTAPQVRDAVGVAKAPDEGAVDVDLDDVATVDAFLDAVAHLADEDRGRPPGGPHGWCPRGSARSARSPTWSRFLRSCRGRCVG